MELKGFEKGERLGKLELGGGCKDTYMRLFN
jgi:hypothetical protein